MPSETVYLTNNSKTSNETSFISNCTKQLNKTVLTFNKQIQNCFLANKKYNLKYKQFQGVTSAHLDAMLNQLKRVMYALLDEIVTYSNNIAKNEQSIKLHSIIQQIINYRITKLLNDFLENISKTWRKGNPLRPLNLELNMLAYWFDRSDIPFNFYYIPSKIFSFFLLIIIIILYKK